MKGNYRVSASQWGCEELGKGWGVAQAILGISETNGPDSSVGRSDELMDQDPKGSP